MILGWVEDAAPTRAELGVLMGVDDGAAGAEVGCWGPSEEVQRASYHRNYQCDKEPGSFEMGHS